VLILKKEMRAEFKKPVGTLYSSISDAKDTINSIGNKSLVISIGDVTTRNMLDEGIIPDVGIVDNMIERQPSDYEICYDNVTLKTKNPPGTITDQMWKTIKEGFSLVEKAGYNVLIVVDGEEDLSAIPCMVMAPAGSIIFYGQPGEGVILCEVDEIKEKAEDLIKKLEEA
jgi:GTP-dependent dephospho-CoA kinase